MSSPVRSVIALVNPNSRNGAGRATATAAVDALRRRGVQVVTRTGLDASDARVAAAEAVRSDVDAVVVIGGDGTIGPVLDAARGTDTRIGLIPAGTGNDHARALDIPTDDPEAAVDIVVAGHSRRVDLGLITSTAGEFVFGTVAAIGLDAAVTKRAVGMRRPRGQSRYALAAVAEIMALAPRHFRVTVDDESWEMDLVMASVGNTPSYGGGMRICPDAVIDDGLLDVTLVEYAPRRRLLRLFPTIYSGTHVSRPEVHTMRGRRIVIESGVPAPASADGDLMGTTPVTVEVLPAAIDFLVPPSHGITSRL
ncbi:diacylglycerol kinase [Williamsia phyllosphaerae]|uniref:DAGKc domain-containing protein n=1 Tax=Williamsia phyllosphaerae TaxID=885042 RepID=A0ABQ1UH56_9NOCA|nr:diacylglycerol kinase [Williamsia phyllosphaerae]GGF16537.1 hypothetical protein GCM10007298_10720 [Williamsia phyllosphaerae]